MRGRGSSQLILGFGQRDVETAFPSLGTRDKELERDRRLAGARTAFEQVCAATLEPPAQHIVETCDFGGRIARRRLIHGILLHGQRRVGSVSNTAPRTASRICSEL